MKVWITRYALTSGIEEKDAKQRQKAKGEFIDQVALLKDTPTTLKEILDDIAEDIEKRLIEQLARMMKGTEVVEWNCKGFLGYKNKTK